MSWLTSGSKGHLGVLQSKPVFNKLLSSAQTAEGRHVGTVVQIAGLGLQRAFDPTQPPEAAIGVVIQIAGIQLAKKMRLISSPYSKLNEYLQATLADPGGFDGDDQVPATLGCPVAIEVSVNGQYTNIVSFHRPESFELGNVPVVPTNELVLLDSPDGLVGDSAKDLFMKLHRDIRGWISQRVRERT